MPTFSVVSSIDINAPASRVRDVVSDFNTWPTWSPWLIMEPECVPTFRGTAGEIGHGYDWQGDKVGAGGMSMTSLDAHRMESDLQFLKPWKSQADIAFDFESLDDNTTRVNWHMDSSLPFFMFFMVNKMKAFIGNDYDRGLRMLKDYVESGSIPSTTTVEGIVDVPAIVYAGKQHESDMETITDSMTKAFPEVFNAVTEMETEMTGKPFSIYTKMDMVKQHCDYTAAIPVASEQPGSNGIECKTRAACKALKVVHIGAYRHLGNAWSTGMQDMRHLKYKADRNTAPFEVYANTPEDTPDEELRTEIFIPVRE